MAIPLVLLAIPSAIVGLQIGLPPEGGNIHTFLEPVFAGPEDTAEGDEVASLYLVQEATDTAEGDEPRGRKSTKSPCRRSSSSASSRPSPRWAASSSPG